MVAGIGVEVCVGVALGPGVTVTVGVEDATVAVVVGDATVAVVVGDATVAVIVGDTTTAVGVLVPAPTIGFVADQSRGTILKLLQCGDMWLSSSSRAR